MIHPLGTVLRVLIRFSGTATSPSATLQYLSGTSWSTSGVTPTAVATSRADTWEFYVSTTGRSDGDVIRIVAQATVSAATEYQDTTPRTLKQPVAADSSGNVTAGTVASGAITAASFAGNAIGSSAIAAGAITSTALASGAITASSIANNAINSLSMANNTITAAKIQDGALTAAKFSAVFPANFPTMAITVGGAVTAGTVSDKTGYTLGGTQAFNNTGTWTGNLSGSVGSVTGLTPDTIATAVESHLLDEGDSQMLINAIVGAIGNSNIDQAILIAAIRADLERSGGNLATMLDRLTSARAGYLDKLDVAGTLAHTGNAASFMSDVSGLLTSSTFAAMTSGTGTDRQFTAHALSNAPTGSGGPGGDTQNITFIDEAVTLG